MHEQPGEPVGDDAEDLLRRALLEPGAGAAVALKVKNLSLSDALTVIFHGRRDLATIETFVALGGHGAGSAVARDALLRVPCDLDLADAHSRDEAEEIYTEQAKTLRDALVAADAVLAVWRDALVALADTPVGVDRSVDLPVSFPAHRLMPVALVAPEQHMTITAVCGARTLAGTPPLGIACAQQELAQLYPLAEDPEECLEDFRRRASDHAHRLADQLDHQEASVERFLELSGGD